MIAPVAAKFRIAGVFGHTTAITAKDCIAIADLFGDMAIKLDVAKDQIEVLGETLEDIKRQLKKVTSEGNDVLRDV